MKKITAIFLLILFICMSVFMAFGQEVVNKISEVKQPVLGRMYYETSSGKWFGWKTYWVQIPNGERVDKATPPDSTYMPCNLKVEWDTDNIERVGDSNITGFRLYVKGNRDYPVQYSRDQINWQYSNEFIVPSTGKCESFYFRVDTCKKVTWGCFLTFSGTSPPDPQPTPGQPKNQIFQPKFESTNNTWDIDQFPDFTMPEGNSAEFGNSSPGFKEWQGSRVKLLRKGVSHYQHMGAFDYYNEDPAKREIQPYESSHFTGYALGLGQAATRMFNEVTKYPGERPDRWLEVESIVHDPYLPHWAGISNATAYDLGQYMQWNFTSNPLTGQYTVPLDGASILLDEETIRNYSTNTYEASRVAGMTLKGWKDALPNQKLVWYGHPWNTFFLYGPETSSNSFKNRLYRYPHDYKDSELLDIRKTQTEAYIHPYFKEAGIYWDISPGYFKNPVVEETIYEMVDGKYVLDAYGHRKLRRDDFITSPYGRKAVMFAHKNAGKTQFEHDNKRGTPETILTDVEYSLQDIYKWHDYMSVAALNKAYNEYGDFNTSVWRKYGIKSAITHRLDTEQWTWGQNGHWGREIGHIGQLYQIMFAWFTGVDHVATWSGGGPMEGYHDGRLEPNHRYAIKPEGQKAMTTLTDPYYYAKDNLVGFWKDKPVPDYWNQDPKYMGEEFSMSDDNYSRFTTVLAANYSYSKAFTDNGFSYKNPGFRKIWFNIPIYGFKAKEIISNGIYQDGKLALLLFYPYHDKGDSTQIELRAGNVLHKFMLYSGRETKMFYFDCPKGLEAKDFTIKYYNIEGNLVWANGVNTGVKEDHYLSEPVVPKFNYPERMITATALADGQATFTDGYGIDTKLQVIKGSVLRVDPTKPVTNLRLNQ